MLKTVQKISKEYGKMSEIACEHNFRENQTCTELRSTISRHLSPPISRWGKQCKEKRIPVPVPPSFSKKALQWGEKWPVPMNLPFFRCRSICTGGVQNQAEENRKPVLVIIFSLPKPEPEPSSKKMPENSQNLLSVLVLKFGDISAVQYRTGSL